MANVHVARARGIPHAADDAKGVLSISVQELQQSPPKFAFDHGAIVAAYIKQFHSRSDALLEGGGRRNKVGVVRRRLNKVDSAWSCPNVQTSF